MAILAGDAFAAGSFRVRQTGSPSQVECRYRGAAAEEVVGSGTQTQVGVNVELQDAYAEVVKDPMDVPLATRQLGRD